VDNITKLAILALDEAENAKELALQAKLRQMTPGPTGKKGDIGPKGDKGDIGPKGDKGDIGLKGDKGDQGDIGPKGDQGDIGPKGDQGDIGPKGDQGAVGPKGDKGDKGDIGEAGASLEVGEMPTNPKDGDSWIGDDAILWEYLKGKWVEVASIVGPRGRKGEKGEKGERGQPGLSGGSGGGVSVHGNLTGLDANDHPQYLLITDLVFDGGNFADVQTPSSFDFDGGAF